MDDQKTGHPPKIIYTLAIMAGVVTVIVSLFVPDYKPIPPINVVDLALFFFVTLPFALIWPSLSWRWGLWLIGPLTFFVVITLATAGEFLLFLKGDLPQLIECGLAACLGGVVGSTLRKGRTESSVESHEREKVGV